MGEYFGIFFCRSSESSSGGSSFVALVGNRLLFSPRHVTGVNPAAKAAVSTSARSTVARIIAVPPMWNLSYLEPVVGGFRKANPDGVHAPTKSELIVNLKTPKALGLAVPPS